MPKPNPIVSYLTVSDGEGAINFYKKAFGAKEVRRHKADDGKRLMHAEVVFNGHSVYLSDDFPEWSGGRTPEKLGGTAVTMHLNLPKPKDVDVWMARAEKAGGKVTMPAADQFWGDRYGKLTDPFGHDWGFGSPLPKPKKAAKKKAPVKKAKAKAKKR
jgi:PhnB protein